MSEEQDAIKLVHSLARKLAFDVQYHERALGKAHKQLALCRAVLKRANYDCDPTVALEYYEHDEDGEKIITSEQMLHHIYGEALYDISYHEEALIKAHQEFAAMKSILKRGKFVEIDLAEIEAEAKKRVETDE